MADLKWRRVRPRKQNVIRWWIDRVKTTPGKQTFNHPENFGSDPAPGPSAAPSASRARCLGDGGRTARRRAMETTSTKTDRCEGGGGRKGGWSGGGAHLLRWKDMPKHLQFNPYIVTGYRPLLSPWGCVHSIFYMHNETVNILTHGKTGRDVKKNVLVLGVLKIK